MGLDAYLKTTTPAIAIKLSKILNLLDKNAKLKVLTATSKINNTYKILGFTDDYTTCDLCEKKNLKGTYAFEDTVGNIKHYGSECINTLFGWQTPKLKQELQKANKLNYNNYHNELWATDEYKLIRFLKNNPTQRKSRYTENQINTFINNFLIKQEEIYNKYIAPYPQLVKTISKETANSLLKGLI